MHLTPSGHEVGGPWGSCNDLYSFFSRSTLNCMSHQLRCYGRPQNRAGRPLAAVLGCVLAPGLAQSTRGATGDDSGLARAL